MTEQGLIERVPGIARAPALPRGGRAQRIADAVRESSGRRWVGVYEIVGEEVVNLALERSGSAGASRLPGR